MLKGLATLNTKPLGLVAEAFAAARPRVTITTDRDEALLGGQRVLRLPDFAAAVRRIATALRHDGVDYGDIVAISMRDGVGVHALVHGLWLRGCIPALVSAKLDPAVALTLLRQLRPARVITDAATVGRYDETLAAIENEQGCRVLVAEGDDWQDTPTRRQLRPDAIAEKFHQVPQWDWERPALLTHTSGTTATEPKLVVHRERSVRLQAQLQIGGAGLLLHGLGGARSYAVAASAAHGRSITGLLSAMALGWNTTVINDVRPEHALPALGAAKADIVESYPNVFLLWETAAADLSRYLAHTRVFFSTYDAVHPRSVDRLLSASRRRMPLYVQGYGQSEVGPISVRFHTRRWARRGSARDGRCVGWPVFGFTGHRVTAGDGWRRLIPLRTGDIQVRTRAISAGYHDGDVYAPRRIGEWWAPGDVGRRMPWGCLHILERRVDSVPGVESTLELEDILLNRTAELTEVILLDDADGVRPVVSTASGEELDGERWAHAVRDLPPMQPPLTIPWEAFPRTPTFKVKRAALARSLRAGGLLPRPVREEAS